MTFFVLLVAVFLLTLCEGSRAVTPVFVQKGNDVLLDVKADVPEKFIILVWKFNESDVLVRYSPGGEPTVSDPYRGRVEFSVKNYSVKLKNLQNTDSGVYTALITGGQRQIEVKYNVTVQVVPNGAIIAGIAVGVLVPCLLVVVLSIYCCKKKKERQFENTGYDVPQEINLGQDYNLNPRTSTYALMEFHNVPEMINTINISPPETIYAQVNRAAKFNSPKYPPKPAPRSVKH